MGKGDKRTRRGKIFKGSFGKKRLRASNKKSAPAVVVAPAVAAAAAPVSP